MQVKITGEEKYYIYYSIDGKYGLKSDLKHVTKLLI